MNKSDTMLLWLILKRRGDDLQNEIESRKKDFENYKNSFVDLRDIENDGEAELFGSKLDRLHEKRDHLKKWIANIEKEIFKEMGI